MIIHLQSFCVNISTDVAACNNWPGTSITSLLIMIIIIQPACFLMFTVAPCADTVPLSVCIFLVQNNPSLCGAQTGCCRSCLDAGLTPYELRRQPTGSGWPRLLARSAKFSSDYKGVLWSARARLIYIYKRRRRYRTQARPVRQRLHSWQFVELNQRSWAPWHRGVTLLYASQNFPDWYPSFFIDEQPHLSLRFFVISSQFVYF